MKFEYKLENWNGTAVFQIIKIPEVAMNEESIFICKNGWRIEKSSHNTISLSNKSVYIPEKENYENLVITGEWSEELKELFESFQDWCEYKYGYLSWFNDNQIDKLEKISNLLDNANYIAMNKSGQWFVYSSIPTKLQNDVAWSSSLVSCKFRISSNILPDNIPWEESVLVLKPLIEAWKKFT